MTLVALSPKLAWSQEGYVLKHWCPNCQKLHSIVVARGPGYNGPVWGWNESLDRPTFSGSLKHQLVVSLTGSIEEAICHYSITNGVIHYYADSIFWLKNRPNDWRTSPMANSNVLLPDMPLDAESRSFAW